VITDTLGRPENTKTDEILSEEYSLRRQQSL